MIRIYSYLPNPRVWKALITADLGGVTVEVVGAKPSELGTWLWDYDARPLSEQERTEDSPHARVSRRGFSGTIYKTDEFLSAHPFGTVPAAFLEGGAVGVFESNSILRAVARAGDRALGLYGVNDAEASRVDSFLDANLVFAREAQVYLLAMDDMSQSVHERMNAAYEFYLSGIESALTHNSYLCGTKMTIADISFVCDFAQFLREGHYAEQLADRGLARISAHGLEAYPRAYNHMLNLSDTAEFSQHMGSYLNWYRRELGLDEHKA